MEALNARVSEINFGWASTQAVKADLASRLLIADGNSFVPRAHLCVVSGRPVTLDWRSIRQADLQNAIRPFGGVHDRGVEAEPFAGGEWVRLGTFQPNDKAEAYAFHNVIAAASSWRGKDFIVFDLRGNGGGSYQWSMAVLRALYGTQMTNYYACERLKIRAYFVPSAVTPDDETASAVDPFDTPHDQLIEQSEAVLVRVRLSNHHVAYQQRPIPAAQSGPPAGTPPDNPVEARIFILTDNNSGSAVNSFLDEVLQFPHVELIGTAPLSDRRSGSATLQLLSPFRPVISPSTFRPWFASGAAGMRCRSTSQRTSSRAI